MKEFDPEVIEKLKQEDYFKYLDLIAKKNKYAYQMAMKEFRDKFTL